MKLRIYLIILIFIGQMSCNVSIDDFEPFYPKPYYSEEYIEDNQGKITFEIKPTQELLTIIYLLAYDLDINATAYQQRFTTYFTPYLDHPIFDLFRSRHTGRSYRTKLISGAYGFSIAEDNTISQAIIGPPNQAVDYEFLAYQAVLEDFAIASDFMQFFRQEALYYQNVIEQQQRLMPIKQMKTWLEDRFPVHYDSHKIVLFQIGLKHSSASYHTEKFSENVNMITSYTVRDEFSSIVNEGLASRMIFTEIDHVYVYPLTGKYTQNIREAFKDKEKWSQNTTGSYPFRTLIFDEYFTHGLFFLYASDYYTGEDLATIIEEWTTFMIESRKFIKFREFKEELIRIYQADSTISMDDLYLQILEWAENE